MIFAAAGLTDVLTEMGALYTANTGVRICFNFAASGALARQLIAAPRADAFVSASPRWMDEVEEAEVIHVRTRRAVAVNRLAVVAHPAWSGDIRKPENLCALSPRHTCVGDPSYVPAGACARQWLETIACADGRTLWAHWQESLSVAPDVRAVLAQVASGEDRIGIVYYSDYASQPQRVRLLYAVPVEDGPAIRFEGAVVSASAEPEEAAGFLRFLQSDIAAEVWEHHGFLPARP